MPTTETNCETLTPAQSAEIAGCSVGFILKMMKPTVHETRRLKSFKVGRYNKTTRAWLSDWMDRN